MEYAIPEIYVQDSLGFDTGVKVTDVYCRIDREADCIHIYGHMLSEAHVVSPDLEPDLQCDVLNSRDQVCCSAVSAHNGVYSVTRKVTFELLIRFVSQSVGWENIAKITLYVIFHRGR